MKFITFAQIFFPYFSAKILQIHIFLRIFVNYKQKYFFLFYAEYEKNTKMGWIFLKKYSII